MLRCCITLCTIALHVSPTVKVKTGLQICMLHMCRNRRATVVQSWVRMWLVRTRFRRTTAAGKKAAARAARHARIQDAAVTLQKYARRYLAKKKVRAPFALEKDCCSDTAA